MPVTINVNGSSNGMSLAHKGSNGIAKNTPPDVCKTPSPGGPVPVPYPVIISMSSDLSGGTTTVKVDGGNMAAVKGSELTRCNGDEAGTAGGVVSSTNMKEAKWLLYSFDVKLDGKNACRLSDKLTMNHANTVCLAGFTQVPVVASVKDIKCAIQKCDKKDADGKDYKIKAKSKNQCSVLGTKKHSCVKKALEKKADPKGNAACEQPFQKKKGQWVPVAKRKGNPRPDVVVGDPNAKPPKYTIYDAKFPCSEKVKGGDVKGSLASQKGVKGEQFVSPDDKERKVYKDIAGKGAVIPLTPEDCKGAKCD